MYRFFKPILFALSPENAHRLTLLLLDLAAATAPGRWLLRRLFGPPRGAPSDAQHLFGLHFPNPVGLAAGFDKDGKHLQGLACLGFGFIEVGTVTPKPQAGNPRPRLFRLPADEALINRMGFNNEGVEALALRLKRLRERDLLRGLIIGGNIGKNKTTPNESAETDYLRCFEVLQPWVDYFVVNVSSPNTPNLRDLQEKEPLLRLLERLQSKNRASAQPKPMLLKIAPDLTDGQLEDVAEIVLESGIDGVIATNTTISRQHLQTTATQLEVIGNGGLSGAPLRARANEVVRYLRDKLGDRAIIIGVGGIDSLEAARERLEAGANLIQVYTGLVYQGPGLVQRINRS